MTTKKTGRAALVVAMLAASAVIAFAPTATAHGGNHGTVKIHDDEQAEPDQRNEPHVSCDFYVEGFNMNDDGGGLEFRAWPPTGDKGVVVPTGDDLTWSGTPEDDQDGYHFLKGPYELPPGHYRVEAFSNGGHPGDHDHFSKTKTFWVEPCERPPPEECPQVGLEAIANDDGSINVSVEIDGDFTLLRGEGSGSLETIGDFNGDTDYLDTNTTAGTAYVYVVMVDEDLCARVVVTAIPVFPSVLAAGVATALGLLGYAFIRRRG